ncbi:MULTISPECIES: hypothetical protein [unclassified Lysobacter]|uniref:hypothetical protein n=1 Tax=unclassified Lysobacter TaxID=2635362 RepID=UPI001BE7B56D|nr:MULTISPECIES: hypothetical protein [unclassified Lysobacter]MBT2748791.1 hypothetical protein [Lysobacter sp. ISL-42]MBT2754327.1 hypothetical protein [Lysobacter sp. ISL-50]MBT2779891.1 hypothetical protein [Lysobacter sp. ISL-54]MBT2783045.1 hypothetical protein [Lysobacter sp. ISL-52]
MLTHVRSNLLLLLALAAAVQGCSRSGEPPASAKQPASVEARAPSSPAVEAPAASAAPDAARTQPRLKPGLWRVEDGVFAGLVDTGKAFICIDAASEGMINRGPARFAADKCSTSVSNKEHGLYLGRTVCKLGDHNVITRLRIDDGQIYFRDVITQPAAATDDSGEKVSDYAEWTAECGADQKPGQAFAQAYDSTDMKPVDLPERLKPAAAH